MPWPAIAGSLISTTVTAGGDPAGGGETRSVGVIESCGIPIDRLVRPGRECRPTCSRPLTSTNACGCACQFLIVPVLTTGETATALSWPRAKEAKNQRPTGRERTV